MSKFGLTRSQKECLAFIEGYIKQHDCPPSYDEIAEGLGLKSKSGVHRLVHALAERGHIILSPNRARSIDLVSGDVFEDEHLTPGVRKQIKAVAAFLNTTPSDLVEKALASYLSGRAA
jgi:SOS-response transcriptional repressor LexA